MAHSPNSPLDRLVGLCFDLLIAAAAVFIAVRLIEAVWTALIVILAVSGIIAAGIAIIRSRGNGW